MKVKYQDQVAFCAVAEGVDSENSLVSTSLADSFPTLGVDDAILIKRVTFHPTFRSETLVNPV